VPLVGWGQLSAGALVAGFVLAIMFGFLIPRWSLVRFLKEKDNLIERQDVLIGKLQTALDRRDQQFGVLIKHAELTVSLLEDLKRVSERSQRTGSP
jgi:hypothetical protein